MKLGSLFDGSGGFPLSGVLNGIEPVWAAEVEPYPIAVTRSRFPHMKHYGNVCKINGAEIEPVDIITFGSPCQDLSVAGKRAGIQDGERSNLFFEAIRIIKEMREATNGEYPKYAVWENVPGAFSSNKGHDFHAVLEALCSVCDDTVSIPEPYDAKRTKLVWNNAGEIVGDNYSVAWRTLDAQYWGVPQRRKRIYLVADFGGQRAGEILFKPDSLRGNLPQSNETGQGAAADAVGSVDGSVGVECLAVDGYNQTVSDICGSIRAGKADQDHVGCTVYSFDSLSSNSMKSSNPYSGCRAVDGSVGVECLNPWDCQSKRIFLANGIYPTLPAMDCGGANNQAVIAFAQNQRDEVRDLGDKAGALAAEAGVHQQTYVAQPVIALQANGIDRAIPINDKATRFSGGGDTRRNDGAGNGLGVGKENDPSPTVTAADRHAVAFQLSGDRSNPSVSVSEDKSYCVPANPMSDRGQAVCYDARNHNAQDISGTIQAKSNGGQSLNYINPVCYDARGNGDGVKQHLFENHSQDTRYKGPLDISPIVSATFGMGGNNQPFVVQEDKPPRKYIIRRLTPTECARLQGFPDKWGHLAPYDPADADFWEDVRKTHAEINGKKYKPVKDIKKWYEKLHNDGAEYKMWGNGIALPNAEYVMRGIKKKEENHA